MIGLFVSLATWVMGSFIGRVLVGAGLGLVTFAGLSVAADQVIAVMEQNYSNLATDVLQIMRLGRIHEAVSLVVSAVLTVLAIRSATVAVGSVGS